jgi:phospholipid/cholesterol/gamma-HCH transport system substrate-binding protein
MDLHYQREVTVGTLVLLGIGLFVGGTMWLKGATFHPAARTAQVRFADIGSLQIDNEVRVSGYPVGKVQGIDFKGPGELLVTITLPGDLIVKSDASAQIVSSVFANASIMALRTGSEAAPLLAEGQVIQGVSGNDVFAKGAALADRADTIMVGLQAIANQRTADDLHTVLVQLQRTLSVMESRLHTTGDEAEKTMRSLQDLSQNLDSTIASLPLRSAISRTDTLVQNMSTMSQQLTTTSARLDTLLNNINRGQGTLGKFATDSGLYTDMRAVGQSLKALIDSLNKHPGKLTVQVKMF